MASLTAPLGNPCSWHWVWSQGILLAAPAQGRASAVSAQKLSGEWDELAAPQEKPKPEEDSGVLGRCSLAPHTTAVPTLPARAQAALPSLPQEPAFGGDEMCWFIPAQEL